MDFSIRSQQNREAIRLGMRAAIPIGLGYFAVSFSLGIAARNAGLTPLQSFIASLLTNASAGEYAGFTMIGASATLVETALMIFIANARYMLMSCAMSQRLHEKTPWYHRLFMGFYITDEIFAVSIAQPGYLNPWFTWGTFFVAAPCWAFGTALGCLAGNLMPLRLVSAFSVALYGMFLAVIIPPAKKDRILIGLIAICFAASFGASYLPVVRNISSGTRTIVLTLLIAGGAALLFPRVPEEEKQE